MAGFESQSWKREKNRLEVARSPGHCGFPHIFETDRYIRLHFLQHLYNEFGKVLAVVRCDSWLSREYLDRDY